MARHAMISVGGAWLVLGGGASAGCDAGGPEVSGPAVPTLHAAAESATPASAIPAEASAVPTSDSQCGRAGDACIDDASCCGGFVCQKFPEGRACVAYAEPDPQAAVVTASVVLALEPSDACGRAGDLCRSDAQCCGGFICQEFPEGHACVAYTEPDPADSTPADGYRETTTHPR